MLGSYICFCLMLIVLSYAYSFSYTLLYSGSMVENFFAITMERVNSLFSRIRPLSQLSVAGVFFVCGTDLVVDLGGLFAASCCVRRNSEEIQKKFRRSTEET